MSIYIICRHNQARSIIAAAAARNLFPDHEVITAGTHADHGQPIPASIVDIAHEWELPNYDTHSQHIGELTSLSADDIIICADREVRDELFTRFPATSPISLDDLSDIPELVPQDPLNLNSSSTRVELAKCVVLTVRYLQSQIHQPSNRIWALHSQSGNRKSELQSAHQWLVKTGGIVIDTDIRIPDPTPWLAAGFSIQYFNPRSLDLGSISKEFADDTVLVSRYETDNPASLLLSRQWQEFIAQLSIQWPLLLSPSLSREFPWHGFLGHVWSETTYSLNNL